MMRRAATLAAVVAALWSAPSLADATTRTILDWTDLRGWAEDDHRVALDVFLSTCPDLTDPEWSKLCAVAQDHGNAKSFFEAFFLPVLTEDGEPTLFTGYYEPELSGSRVRTNRYRWPIYRKPSEVKAGQIWHSRAEIEEYRMLDGRGLELVWIDDPVDVFFLQVQGSGRIRLTDGSVMRVGYGGRNGHEYRSVGRELVRRGLFEPHQVSAATIRNWVRRNPHKGANLLRHNPSFIFFREVSQISAEAGPLGAMNRSVTPLRSIAVDPEFTPLGAPVWIEKNGEKPMSRLMVAQDTGSAIKGAQRVDIFYGSGKEAGDTAGSIRDSGRIVTLLPIQRARELIEGY